MSCYSARLYDSTSYITADQILKGTRADPDASQDLDKDDTIPEPFQQAPAEQVFALQKQEIEERKKRDKRRQAKLQAYGFEGEHGGETIL